MMKLKNMARLAVLAGTFAAGQASAQAATPAPAPAASSVPGWDAFIESLRTLPDRMLARLPESMRSDPQVRQEIARLALEAIASQTLDAVGADPDHPQFLPSIGQVLNIGQPNADTIYRGAKIAPGGTYRLRGERGSLRMAVIAETGPRPAQIPGSSMPNLGPPRPVHDLNALPVDAHGRYDVILSPVKPKGYDGAWWELNPTSNNLLLRLVSSDWAGEREPTIAIERLDRPVERPRPSA
ncbi:MAG: hypothetical protein JF593_14455, partial [Novosphingobium sp.]|nr:hypothetical protein [Novosphingobium sp.]